MTSIPHLLQRLRPRAAGLLSILIISGAATLAVSPAAAAARGGPMAATGQAAVDDAAGAVALKGDLSLDEAIDRAQKRYRARVVRAEQVEQGGRVVYVLRLLSDEDGRVFTVRVDARSGDMQ
jgi:uncharacterized membrane protein YkoI